jgi:hypothetical protein
MGSLAHAGGPTSKAIPSAMKHAIRYIVLPPAEGARNAEQRTFKDLLRCDRTAAMEPVAEQPEVSLTEGLPNEKLFSVVPIKEDVGWVETLYAGGGKSKRQNQARQERDSTASVCPVAWTAVRHLLAETAYGSGQAGDGL